MPETVYIIWTILLAVTILVLPLIVRLLHRTWRAAHDIERYLSEMAEAGQGIADNTSHIETLGDTISTAGGILETAGDINEHTRTIEETLETRAKNL